MLRRGRQSGRGSDAGSPTSLCYLHGKQKQSTLGCGMHVGTQREPTPGSMRKTAGGVKSIAQLGQIISERARHVGLPETKALLQIAGFGHGECPFRSVTVGRHISSRRFPCPMGGCGARGPERGGTGSVRGRLGARGACVPLQKGWFSLFWACDCFAVLGQTATCLCLAGFRVIKGLEMHVCLAVLCTSRRNCKYFKTVG